MSSIYTELFELSPSKAQQRTIQIVEAAIKGYATLGVEKTTYEHIAKACKISRPLVQHYFKDRMDLFELSVEYIRVNMQKMAIQAVSQVSTPRDQLEAYIRSTFEWQRQYPLHARVWKLFFYFCSIDKRFLKLNTQLTQVGHQRIVAMLKEGVKQEQFHVKSAPTVAKMIQTIITGSLMTIATEDNIDSREIEQSAVKACLGLLQ